MGDALGCPSSTSDVAGRRRKAFEGNIVVHGGDFTCPRRFCTNGNENVSLSGNIVVTGGDFIDFVGHGSLPPKALPRALTEVQMVKLAFYSI